VPAEVDGSFAEMGRVVVSLATRAQEEARKSPHSPIWHNHAASQTSSPN
jgi:hypothetical protein